LDICGYRIREATEFGWHCYGPNARAIDFSLDYRLDADVVSAVFDTVTLRVYEMDVFAENAKGRVYYRWIDPDYIHAYRKETEALGLGETFDLVYEAETIQASPRWTFVDEETLVQKAREILQTDTEETNSVEGSGTTALTMEIENSTLFQMMLDAHALDMTLNSYVNGVMREYIADQEGLENDLNTDVASSSEPLVEPSWEQRFALAAAQRRAGNA
jgi:hypothetical protein